MSIYCRNSRQRALRFPCVECECPPDAITGWGCNLCGHKRPKKSEMLEVKALA